MFGPKSFILIYTSQKLYGFGNHAIKYQDNPAIGVRRISFAVSVCASLCVGRSFLNALIMLGE